MAAMMKEIKIISMESRRNIEMSARKKTINNKNKPKRKKK